MDLPEVLISISTNFLQETFPSLLVFFSFCFTAWLPLFWYLLTVGIHWDLVPSLCPYYFHSKISGFQIQSHTLPDSGPVSVFVSFMPADLCQPGPHQFQQRGSHCTWHVSIQTTAVPKFSISVNGSAITHQSSNKKTQVTVFSMYLQWPYIWELLGTTLISNLPLILILDWEEAIATAPVKRCRRPVPAHQPSGS